MPTITPNRELHQLFMDWGFDPLPSAHAYTGMVAIPESTREQEVHVVFTEDNTHFHLQSVVEAEAPPTASPLTPPPSVFSKASKSR